MVEIFFRDLTPEKQQEIIEALGDNGNYDVFPIACIPTESEEPGEGKFVILDGEEYAYTLFVDDTIILCPAR